MGYPRKWYPQRQRTYSKYRHNVITDIPLSDLNLDRVFIDNVPYTGGDDPTEYGWGPQQRPIKEISRHVVAKASKKNKKHLMVFPASTGRDIELLRHYKVGNTKSKWTLVEKETKYRNLLKQRGLFKNNKNILDHEELLHALRSSDIKEKFGSVIKYDFAWFDLFGNLGLSDIFWLKDSFPADFANLDLFFTFKFSARGNKTSLVIRDTLWDWHPAEMHETRLSIRPTKKLQRQKTQMAGVNYDPRALSRGRLMDQSMAAHWQTFKYIFSGHTFDTKAWVYNDEDHSEMLLYHLNNFKPSSEDYAFADKIHIIIDVFSKYNGNTDAQIAEYTELSKSKIKKWRALNKLPGSEKFSQYRLAVGLESLLISDEIPTDKFLANLCCQRLEEFHPFIADKIKCSTQGDEVQVISPKRKYVITIGDNVEYDPNKLGEVKIIPEFLSEPNRGALFSVFRNLFRGDEFLHPQLCNFGYENCFILSDPQKEAITAWLASYNLGEKTGAIVLPTGMGKTIVAAHIINEYAKNVNPNLKILFFTKYREILRGAIDKFKTHTRFTDESYYCRFYGANKSKFDCLLKRPCVFATDASLVKLNKGKTTVKKGSPLLDIPRDHFDIIIADEAHHVNAGRWSAIIDHFKGRGGADFTLGLTATPFRGDAQDPLTLFDNNAISRKNLNLGIWEGYLSWPDFYLYEDNTNYKEILDLFKEGLGSKRKKKQANEKIKRIHQRKCLSEGFQSIVLEKYLKHAAGKKTLGFAPNKSCARSIAAYFTKKGVPASYLTSYTKEDDGSSPAEYWERREKIYNDFENGKIHVLFSVEIFNEGVDFPDVEALIKLNKTNSPVKIIQQLGRGLRLFPNKSSVTVLDFVGNCHDLDSFINLGIMTGINTRLLQRLQRKRSIIVDEDLPIIPASNFHISEGAKFIIKYFVEDATMIKLSPILERQVINACKKGYYWWKIYESLGVTREQAQQLCKSVTASIDEELRDKIKGGLSYLGLIRSGMAIETLSSVIKVPISRIEEHMSFVNRESLIRFIQQCDSLNTAASILGIPPLELEDLIAE